METGRFGFAGSTTAQVYKGRYMDNRYGAGTAPSALRPLDFVLKKAPTHNVDISQDTGPFDIVKDEAVLVLTDVENLSSSSVLAGNPWPNAGWNTTSNCSRQSNTWVELN